MCARKQLFGGMYQNLTAHLNAVVNIVNGKMIRRLLENDMNICPNSRSETKRELSFRRTQDKYE